MSEVIAIKYDDSYKEKWEKFVLNNSVNGTFLASRNFLEYHKDRFNDYSLIFMRGGNTIVGVCPACEINDENGKSFISHIGSTFGGIIVGKEYYNISNVSAMVDALEEYLKANGFNYVLMKNPNEIFASENCNLIDYFFYNRGYSSYDELSFAIDFSKLKDNDVVMNFKGKTRNLYRSSLKENLELKPLTTKEEIADFYKVLCKSLEKYNTKPVHSLEELYELYFDRLPNNIRFYGVTHEGKIIAGSMVFILNDVFHTQYLCADPECLYLKPMDFMDGNLIILAHEEGKKFFSFGISTEDHGKYLNENLAKFKEGFGTQFYINKSYTKKIS